MQSIFKFWRGLSKNCMIWNCFAKVRNNERKRFQPPVAYTVGPTGCRGLVKQHDHISFYVDIIVIADSNDSWADFEFFTHAEKAWTLLVKPFEETSHSAKIKLLQDSSEPKFVHSKLWESWRPSEPQTDFIFHENTTWNNKAYRCQGRANDPRRIVLRQFVEILVANNTNRTNQD